MILLIVNGGNRRNTQGPFIEMSSVVQREVQFRSKLTFLDQDTLVKIPENNLNKCFELQHTLL